MVDNGFIHPLPPPGYSRLSQGESQLQKHCASNCPLISGRVGNVNTAPATVPLRQGDERSGGGG